MHDEGVSPTLLIFLALLFFAPLRLVLYTYVVIPRALADSSTHGDSMFKLVVISSLQNASNTDGLGIYSLSTTRINNVNINANNLNSIDDYDEAVTPCDDFYSKVCSLFDPQSNENEPLVPKGGTFRTMINDNSRIIEKIVKTYPQYNECRNLLKILPSEDGVNNAHFSLYWSAVEQYIKDENIQTIFDVYMHGGLAPFVINFDAKVLNDSKYCTEIDINFDFYFYAVYDILAVHQSTKVIDIIDGTEMELQELLKELYMRLDMSLYPTSLVEYTRTYKKVENINDKYLSNGLIDVLGLSPNVIVMLNRQDRFFSYIFEVLITKKLPVPMLQRLLSYQFVSVGFSPPPLHIVKVQRTGDKERKRSDINNEINVDEIIDKRNLMWARLNHHHKIITKRTVSDEKNNIAKLLDTSIDHFCSSQIRDTFFVDINTKFYQAINIKSQANYIEYLVRDVIHASSSFFGQNTGFNSKDNTNSIPFNDDEYLLHISSRTASKAKFKMDEIIVNSMASIASEEPMLLSMSEQETEALQNEDYPSCYFKAKNRVQVGYGSVSRSGEFLLDRKNTTLAQLILWTTVKAETVNAWYDPTANTITIPTGIARYPLFRGDYTYDVSFLGAVIGHELGHATDSSGNQFDEIGSFVNGIWWDLKDIAYLERKTKCLVNDYGQPCGSEVYGQHTLGEDMADQFGLRIVLTLAKNILLNTTLNVQSADSLDLSQMIKNINKDVFINFARVWCGRSTYRQECDNVQHDVHALAKDRVIKTLRQFKTFSDAFGCKDDDPMINIKRCIVY